MCLSWGDDLRCTLLVVCVVEWVFVWFCVRIYCLVVWLGLICCCYSFCGIVFC